MLVCQRCRRPICPECMVSAPVGFQCRDCVAAGLRQTRQNQAAYGGTRSAHPSLTSIVLMAVNVAVWTLVLLTGGNSSRWVEWLGIRPSGTCFTADATSFFPGATQAQCATVAGAFWAPGVSDGAWWQIITSGFTHVEPLHIGFNMLALWILGPQLETAIGRTRFLAIYLLSLVGGSVAVVWLSESYSLTLGASGAVFGLIGALLVIGHKVHANIQPLLIWLGINVVVSLWGSGVSWQGHLGGLIGGAIASVIIAYAPRQNRTTVQAVSLAALGLVMLITIVARAVLGG